MAENKVEAPADAMQTKEAEAVNAERLVAFGYGVETLLKEAGFTADAVSQAAAQHYPDSFSGRGENLTPETVNWLTAQLEAEKQAEAQAAK